MLRISMIIAPRSSIRKNSIPDSLVLILVRRHVGLILHALAPDQVSAGGMGVRIAGAVLLGGPVIH
jgi:hypothetical protein